MYEKTNTGAVKKYYTAFGRTIAIRDVPTGSGAGTLYYALPDHLGSTSTVLDANGAIASSQRYWPYGATRSGSVTQTDRLYTGQREEPGDAAMGLYNYKARFYSTTLGRFVSADILVPLLSSSGLNRYAYAFDNPLRWRDDDGRNPGCDDGDSSTPCAEPLGWTDLDRCRADFANCARLAYALRYGVSELGFIIVMGLIQSNTDTGDVNDFEGFIDEFLSLTSGCGGRVAYCREGFYDLIDAAGADAAYDVFGIKMIESDPNGHGIQGILSYLGGRGERELNETIRDPRGKTIIGVMGFSYGAGTVARYYAKHPELEIGVWINEPAGADIAWRGNKDEVRAHPYFAGENPWNDYGGHGANNMQAEWIIAALAITTLH